MVQGARSDARAKLPAFALVALLLGSTLVVADIRAPTLPGEASAADGLAASACFSGTPDVTFDVAAIDIRIVLNTYGIHDPWGRMYVLASQEAAVRAAVAASPLRPVAEVQPLVLRAHLGDCVEVRFTNHILDTNPVPSLLAQGFPSSGVGPTIQQVNDLGNFAGVPDTLPTNPVEPLADDAPATPSLERASMHIHKALTAVTSQGSMVGANPDSTVAPGEDITYRWYLPDDPDWEGSYYIHSHADPRYQAAHGLFGALIAEPQGYDWLDPVTAAPSTQGWEAMLTYLATAPDKADHPDFREIVTIFHDEILPCLAISNPLACEPVPNIDGNAPNGQDAMGSGAYGPDTKAINYRSEAFRDRFGKVIGEIAAGNLTTLGSGTNEFVRAKTDHSQAYGTYGNGDPATPIARAYVGDPTKWRLVSAGPGQHHVFHLHGGGDRWRFQPGTDDTQFDEGVIKSGNVAQSASERLDVQNIGPGEAFNLEIEGGAGGVQGGVGDFLYHCHIVEHYVAGMWGMWRVYDTLQHGTNPAFPGQRALQPLPDRAAPPVAVNSVDLVGQHLFASTDAEKVLVAGPTDLGASPPEVNVNEWVQALLPAKGVPRVDDASVWDWTTVTTSGLALYLGEPEVNRSWENYVPQSSGLWNVDPGKPGRPELQFNPDNGRPAYPMLHPHLGKRPPFAADHGPTPYLGQELSTGNPLGLCVPDAQRTSRQYNVVALAVPVSYNSRDTDPLGEIFVLAEDKATVVADPKLAENLILRANVHDCVDVTFSSALEDSNRNFFHSKVNMHIHLVQFDVQASDGVITGNNFEQSVRPAKTGSEMTTLATAASASATSIVVANVTPFLDATGAPKLGSLLGLGITTPSHEEAKVLGVDVATKTVTLDRALGAAHAAGELVGYEFVHYRWYPDVELGMVYWHDHVDGINSWAHGLFGGLVVEPAGATWTSPRTGAHLKDGTAATAGNPYADPHLVDVHVAGEPDYREFVAALQDRICELTLQGSCGGQGALLNQRASFNLRNAPWDLRKGTNADANYFFSSVVHGDPASDTWRAYAGDPVVVRLLYAGQSTTRGVDTFSISGHRFALERHQPKALTLGSLSFGISSQFNLELECGAGSGYEAVAGNPGSCTGQHAGDFLYRVNNPDTLLGGAWGVFRVHDKLNTSLLPLPDRASPTGPVDTGWPATAQARSDVLLGVAQVPDPAGILGTVPALPTQAGNVGPPGAPVRHYDLAAISLPIAYGPLTVKANAALYVPLGDVPSLARGALQPQPLVLRANEGEVVEVSLTNLLGVPPARLMSLGDPAQLLGLQVPGLPAEKTSAVQLDRVSLAPSLLSVDPLGSGGVTVGYDPDMAVAPGETRTFRWYADKPLGAAWLGDMAQFSPQDKLPPETLIVPHPLTPEVGPTLHTPIDAANNRPHLERGLFGMLVIEPAGSSYEDPLTHEPLLAGPAAVIRSPAGDFREFAVLFESQDDQFASSTMPYDPSVQGMSGANYRTASWATRLGFVGSTECAFNTDDCTSIGMRDVRSPLIHLAESSRLGDPLTGVFEAFAGESVVFRALTANGAQLHVFNLEGHAWRLVHGQAGSNLVDAVTIGPGDAANAWVVAGGEGKSAADARGDYLWLDHRSPFEEAGIWGLLRVHDPADPLDLTAIEPL
jgi:FtsP/CotA-like multicopper oxidase with cupredoxin domain